MKVFSDNLGSQWISDVHTEYWNDITCKHPASKRFVLFRLPPEDSHLIIETPVEVLSQWYGLREKKLKLE